MNAVFQEQPIVYKLWDLGEARSRSCTNLHDHKEYTYTLYYYRSSTTFMAPEILILEELLELAGIIEMKKIDVWALLMTIINPDQTHPFELNINESKKSSTGKVLLHLLSSS